MAIDYNSGAGLFDKVGKVVALTNVIETWEITNSGENLEKEMSDLEAILDETVPFDRTAKNLLLQKWSSYKQSLDQMKIRLTELTRLLMASEIVIQDHFDSDGLNPLCVYLREAMIRDSESVDQNTVTVPDFTIASVLTVRAYASGNDTDNPDESASQPLSGLHADSLNLEVTSVTTPGAEVIDVFGTNPPATGGSGSPDYQHSGKILSSYTIRSYAQQNKVVNGSFQGIDSANRLTGWNASTGVWGTAFSMVVSSHYAFSTRVLQFATNGKLVQTLRGSSLKPRTKYILYVSAEGVGSPDGTLLFGCDLHASSFGSQSLSIFGPDAAGDLLQVFNTEDQVRDCTLFLERSGASTDQINIVGFGLWEMIETPMGWFVVANVMDTQTTLSFPTVLGVPSLSGTKASTNNHAGRFTSYFNRFMETRLPSAAISTITDTLAA